MPDPNLERSVLRQLYGALDTAVGVIELVERDVKPVDLPDCKVEILAARDLVGEALGDE